MNLNRSRLKWCHLNIIKARCNTTWVCHCLKSTRICKSLNSWKRCSKYSHQSRSHKFNRTTLYLTKSSINKAKSSHPKSNHHCQASLLSRTTIDLATYTTHPLRMLLQEMRWQNHVGLRRRQLKVTYMQMHNLPIQELEGWISDISWVSMMPQLKRNSPWSTVRRLVVSWMIGALVRQLEVWMRYRTLWRSM